MGEHQDLWDLEGHPCFLPLSRAACLSSGWHLRPYLTESTHTRVMCESWMLRVWSVCQQSLSYPTERVEHLPKAMQPWGLSETKLQKKSHPAPMGSPAQPQEQGVKLCPAEPWSCL